MIRVELVKLLLRPRTWITIALLAALPTLVAILLALTDIAPRPGDGPVLLSQVLGNGRLFPAAALAIVLPIFLPVAVSVVAGESVAGEASQGTLRYLLVRPVGRTHLLVAKLVAVVVFILLAVTVVAVVGYVVGTSLFGSQPLPTVSGRTLSTTEQVLRIVAAMLYVGWSMLGVGAVALFLSTLTDSALQAALGALAVLVSSTVLVTLDAADTLKPYLPTRYWLAFVDFFRDPILWRDIERGFALQAVYVVVLLLCAWAAFATKDVTS